MDGDTRTALIATTLGSAPGLMLPFAMTSHFGVGRATDAYFYAFSFGNFGAALCSGVLQSNALPLMHRYKLEGRAAFLRFVSRTAVQGATAVVVLYAAVAGVATFLVLSRSNWTAPETHAALFVLGALVPFLMFVAVNSALASALYSVGDFAAASGSIAMRSVFPGAGLLVIGTRVADIHWLAVLLVVGECTRAVLLAVLLARRARLLEQQDVRPVALSGMWRAAGPSALSIAVLNINPVIDRIVAGRFSAGSVTLIDLAEKIFWTPWTALSSSVVLVIGTRWSALGQERKRELLADYRNSVRSAALIASAFAVLTAMFVILVTIVRGSTFAGAPAGQLRVLSLWLLVGLPPAIVASLGARLHIATQRTSVMPLLAAIGVCVNVGADLLGADLFGLTGIVVASTIVRLCDALLYTAFCTSWLRSSGARPVRSSAGAR